MLYAPGWSYTIFVEKAEPRATSWAMFENLFQDIGIEWKVFQQKNDFEDGEVGEEEWERSLGIVVWGQKVAWLTLWEMGGFLEN